MQSNRSLSEAYELGREWFAKKRGDKYGGSREGTYFVLPFALWEVRGTNFPSFDELSATEKFGLKIVYDVITDTGDPIAEYPEALEDITILECLLIQIRGSILERTADGKLTDDSLRLINSAFGHAQNIVSVARKLDWTGPRPQRVERRVGDLEWHVAHPDPDLWHILAAHVNYDLYSSESFLLWLVEHPLCDRATAAFLFLTCCGPDFITGDNDADALKKGDHFCWRVVKTICARSEQEGGYRRSELTLSEHGLPDDQSDLLKKLGNRSDCVLPIPYRLLGTPFIGRRAETSSVFVAEDVFVTEE